MLAGFSTSGVTKKIRKCLGKFKKKKKATSELQNTSSVGLESKDKQQDQFVGRHQDKLIKSAFYKIVLLTL